MGPQLCVNLKGKDGNSMVETQLDSKEWPTNTPPSFIQGGVDNSCGRVGHRLGSTQYNIKQGGLLDRTRKATADKRSGADSNLLCLTPPRKNIKSNRDQSTHGQYDSIEVCDKIRRHGFYNIARFSGEDTRSLQSVSSQNSIPSCGRSEERRGGHSQSSKTAHARDANPETVFQSSEATLGKEMEDRCVCSSPQSSSPSILESAERPFCQQSECIQSRLEEKRFVHVPPVEVYTASFKETQIGQDDGGDSGDSAVDNTILVPHATTDETIKSTDTMGSKQVESDRMALVYNKRKSDDLISYLKLSVHDLQHAVKKHANWFDLPNTFKKHYYKPVGQGHDSTQNSIFSAENRATSESEAKATRIVLGTTYNTKVAGAKEEEVVQPNPGSRYGSLECLTLLSLFTYLIKIPPRKKKKKKLNYCSA